MISFFFSVLLGVGVVFVGFSNNWLLIWVWIECVTLCLIILFRSSKVNIRNLEAISKYFVTQAIASLLILIGVILRYFFLEIITLTGGYNYLSYGFIIVGLLVKLGVFPNPYWFVDVVNGVEYSRLIYLLIVSKVVPLYLLFNVVSLSVFLVFGAVGVLTALVSSVLGINQSNFRKLISFSSVANLGWFILCLPVMKGLVVIFCFLGYSLTVVPLVWVSNNLKFTSLNKVSRLYYDNSSKLLILLCLLSLGGLPPFVGFFVKWAFFQSLVNNNLYTLSVVLVISSLFSLFFYLYSSFNIHSLFSANIKNQNLLLSCSDHNFYVFIVSLSLVGFVGLAVFVGILW
uniref:NADH-ubiquinone oxidoreductase chain 2 n=1 Tax=Macrophiothrix sp. TaxID=3135532 RepID=A0AAU6PX27_9ECHI